MKTITRYLVFCSSLISCGAHASATPQERECLETFSTPHRWNLANPKERHWGIKCWDFVSQQNGKWIWIGSKNPSIPKSVPSLDQQLVERWCVTSIEVSKVSSRETCDALGGEAFLALAKANQAFLKAQKREKVSPDSGYPAPTKVHPLTEESLVESPNPLEPEPVPEDEVESTPSGNQESALPIPAAKNYDGLAVGIIALIALIAGLLFLNGRRKLLGKYEQKILEAYSDLTADDYFSAQRARAWKEKFSELSLLRGVPEIVISRNPNRNAITEVGRALLNVENWRKVRNERYVADQHGKYKEFFDSIEKYPLTGRQRDAIISCENRCLTIAGAGTGKTSTVVGRVSYLLEKSWCRPSEILVMSYTDKAVKTLQEKIEDRAIEGVDIKTFHSLGKQIIEKAECEKYSVLADPPTIEFLKEFLESKKQYLKIVEYLSQYFYPERYEDSFNSAKESNEFATIHNIRTLKTLQAEKVRSVQEVKLANWLFLNGVSYEYEQPYPVKQYKHYRPDFFLSDYEIYIEHFGINRDGSTRKDIDPKQYKSDMEWKWNLHKENETELIATYSYQFREGSVFSILEKSLKDRGVEFNPLTTEQVKKTLKKNERLAALAQQLGSFLTLYRENPEGSVRAIESSGKKEEPQQERFLAIFEELRLRYESYLKDRKQIDFADMMSMSLNHLREGKYKSPYRAIIVDEYQDISRARIQLIDELFENRLDTRLLCVGDDWQSIYRFSGSDISMTTKFEEKYEDTIRIDLDKTFRFKDKLLSLSSTFVTQNPNQLKKTITTNQTSQSPAIYLTSQPVENVLEKLKKERIAGDQSKEVCVLGRYKHTFRNISTKTKQTVHSAKGLEWDYVIVPDLFSDPYGFPCGLDDDPNISMLLPQADSFPFSDERRVFYVALTRAREEVWLIVPSDKSPSIFVEELIKKPEYKRLFVKSGLDLNTEALCPECDSLLRRKENKTSGELFFGCVHYPRCRGTRSGCRHCGKGVLIRNESQVTCSNASCDLTHEVCPRCENGILVRKINKTTEIPFLSCDNRTCSYTQSADD
jgi:DNA helicase IV